MEMGNSGIRIITAITISGCSLLFLAFLKNVYTEPSQSQTAQEQLQQRENEKNEKSPAAKRSSVSSAGKKKVRFSEDVEEPSKNNAEYRRRRRGGQKAAVRKREGERAEKRIVELPANRSALYSGMHQYRSHMSTLMIYG